MKKIENIGFVGGNTRTMEYDFGTKVAGSVVECPLKIYYCTMSAIQPPTNITGNVTTGWKEETLQSNIDNLKSQDGAIIPNNYVRTNGSILQTMIELDLTPFCNALFGGSNSALKSALKTIQADAWASGSGNNAGVLTIGCSLKIWSNSSTWERPLPTNNPNTTASIAKMSVALATQVDSAYYVNSANKIFILLAASYASDGTIASTVNLDYTKLTIQFTRVPDYLKSIPLEVNNKNWSVLIKGFSPSWDNTQSGSKRIWLIYKDTNNKFSLSFNNGKLYFEKFVNGKYSYIASSSQVFSKFQVYNILCEQTPTKMRMRILKNNGTIEKIEGLYIDYLIDTFNIYILGSSTGYEADAILEELEIFDTNFDDDSQAQAILKGQSVAESYNIISSETVNREIDWETVQCAKFTVDTIETLKVGGYFKVGATVYSADEISNNIIYSYWTSAPVGQTLLTVLNSNNPDDVRVVAETVELAKQYENPNLFDVNKLANTTYATINGDTVVLTPTVAGTPQAPNIYIPVLPNNKYRLRGNINAANSAIVTTEFYNSIVTKNNTCNLDGTGLDKTFITSSKTNKVKIYLYPVNTNVQTFSDIYFARED